MLDPAVEEILHLGAPRIDDDAPVPERARPELHPPLEPADHFPRRNLPGNYPLQLRILQSREANGLVAAGKLRFGSLLPAPCSLLAAPCSLLSVLCVLCG